MYYILSKVFLFQMCAETRFENRKLPFKKFYPVFLDLHSKSLQIHDLTLSHAFRVILFVCLWLFLSLSFTLSFCLSPSLFDSHSLSLFLSLSLSLSLSHTLSLSLSLSFVSHSLSLSLFLQKFPSFTANLWRFRPCLYLINCVKSYPN